MLEQIQQTLYSYHTQTNKTCFESLVNYFTYIIIDILTSYRSIQLHAHPFYSTGCFHLVRRKILRQIFILLFIFKL